MKGDNYKIMTVGDRIKKLRTKRKMTQKQLGDLIGIEDSNVRKYESGRLNAKPDTLEKIANALDVNVEALLYSELNYTRAMHQIYRIIENYGGEINYTDHVFTDKNGNSKTEKVAAVYFGALTPFIKELQEKKEKLTPEKYEEYKNKFPASSDIPSSYLDTCAEFDKKLAYISDNIQDGPYSSDEWDEHMKNLKNMKKS